MSIRKILPILTSCLILVVIYYRLDLSELENIFLSAHVGWLLLVLALTALLPLLSALRLKLLMPTDVTLGMVNSLKLVLAANALNTALPAKMGDFIKAYFMRQKGYLSGPAATAVVIFEKAAELISLLSLCSIGFIFYPEIDLRLSLIGLSIGTFVVLFTACVYSRVFLQVLAALFRPLTPRRYRSIAEKLYETWCSMQEHYVQHPMQIARVLGVSLATSFLQLSQVWVFIWCLHAYVPYTVNLALTSLAVLVGFLPVTFAGIGARDAALIAFYGKMAGPSTAAALGILLTVRMVLLGLAGVPFVAHYVRSKP